VAINAIKINDADDEITQQNIWY